MKNFFSNLRNDPIRYLMAALFLFLPFERIPSHSVAGVNLRINLFVGLALIIAAAVTVIRERRLAVSRIKLPLVFIGLFLLWNIFLIPFAVNRHHALEVVIFTAFTVGIAVSLVVLFKERYTPTLLRALFGGALIVGLFGLYQYFGNVAGLSGAVTGLRSEYSWQLFGFPRIQAASLEPLYFAAYLLLPISVLISLMLERVRRLPQIAFWFLLLLATCLFLTVSRGGYAALAASLVILLGAHLYRRSTSGRRIIQALAIIVVGFGLSFLLISKINKPSNAPQHQRSAALNFTDQIETTGLAGGGDPRTRARRLALQLFKEHPLLGVGPGNFGPVVQPDLKSGWTIVNNEPLELLAETGIIGFLLFAGFTVSLLVLLVQAIKDRRAQRRALLIGLGGYIIGTIVQYQTFSTLYIIVVWTALGLTLALLNRPPATAKAPAKAR
jgi:O-antigen ligase